MATFIRSRKDMVEAGSRSGRLLYSAAGGEQKQKSKGGGEGEESAESGEGSQKLAKDVDSLRFFGFVLSLLRR